MLKYPIRINRVATTFKTYDNIKELTPTVDLRSECPPVQSQLKIGSCTAHALLAAFQFNDPKFAGSRLFLYYNERFLDGDDVQIDDGSTLSQGVKALIKYGVCDESMWPYVDDGLKYRTKPPEKCYTDALSHQVLSANNIAHDLTSIKQCLSNGRPFVFGMMVYSSFESAQVVQTGMVPMPNTLTEQFLGGHAVMCVGYDDYKKVFIVRNSWGPNWGDGGHCYLPYEYLTDPHLTTDLWEIIKVETVDTPVQVHVASKPNKPTPKPHPITPIPRPAPPKTVKKNVVKPVINARPPVPVPAPQRPPPKPAPSPAPKIIPKPVVTAHSKPKHQGQGKQTNRNTAVENKFHILMKNRSQNSKSYIQSPTVSYQNVQTQNNNVKVKTIVRPNSKSHAQSVSHQNAQVQNKNNNNVKVNTITRPNSTFANKKVHAHLVTQSKPNFHAIQQHTNTSLPVSINKNASVSSPNTGPQTVSIKRLNTSLAKFIGPRKVFHQPRPVR